MKPPKFWYYAKPNWQSRLLSPLASIWQSKTRKRVAEQGARADCPVISVGNINLGGTGKTPTTIYLVQHLQNAGWKPVVILRGYKGEATTPQWVENQSAKVVGDEAILLAQFTPTIVSQDRAAAAKMALEKGNIIILDDALQNPSLVKDISLCVFDGEVGLGNGQICPAGPLRESLTDAAPRIDAFLIIGEDRHNLAKALVGKPIFTGQLSPIEMGIDWHAQRFIAFAGIGRPEKFFNTLRHLGATLVATHAFDDHETYSPNILNRMLAEAREKNASLITTEKDSVRLPKKWQGQILSLPVRLEMTGDDLGAWVLGRLKN